MFDALMQTIRAKRRARPYGLDIENFGLLSQEARAGRLDPGYFNAKTEEVFGQRVSGFVVARGAAPKEPETYQALEHFGIRTVLDLRPFDLHSFMSTKAFGMQFVNVPMDDHRPPVSELIRQAVGVLAPRADPVFVHCEGGKHRTGAVIAAFRVLVDGWTAERAFEEARDYSFYSWRHPGWEEYIKALKQ